MKIKRLTELKDGWRGYYWDADNRTMYIFWIPYYGLKATDVPTSMAIALGVLSWIPWLVLYGLVGWLLIAGVR